GGDGAGSGTRREGGRGLPGGPQGGGRPDAGRVRLDRRSGLVRAGRICGNGTRGGDATALRDRHAGRRRSPVNEAGGPMSEHDPAAGAGFPKVRPRRLRYNPLVRGLVRETTLDVSDLILPLFVRPGRGVRNEIPSMPGVAQFSVDRLVEEVGAAMELGVRA